MTQEEYRTAVDDVVYLVSCAVNGEKADAERIAAMDLGLVFEAARRHQLTAAAGMALQSAGIRDARFDQETAKAQRKSVLLDTDRAALTARLEEAGIWYMPLKGAVLQDLYPRCGMRQMADNDILIDASRAGDVQDIMEGLGFSTERIGLGNHDVYHKPPVSNFEIHTELFHPLIHETLYPYYRDVKSRLIKDEGNNYGWHFTPEDFYVYLTAHAYKHFAGGGTGLRTFLDVYVFLRLNSASLDMAYIGEETVKLGIADFEQASRSLALHLYGGAPLTEKDEQTLAYVIQSGTYGTAAHRVENQVAKLGGGTKGKIRFVFRRLFLPMDAVRAWYPLFDRYRVLLPLLPFVRLRKALTISRRKVQGELRALLRKPSDHDGELHTHSKSE